MESKNGDYDGNRRRAEEYIIEAIKKGAQLISLISKKSGVICSEVEIGEKSSSTEQIIPQGRWYLPYNMAVRFITEFTQKTGKIRYKYSSKRKRVAVG